LHIEIRWHGRGGQGAVTASDLLAKAAIREGKWAQSFPMFGMERRGAPVTAFTRISDEPILQHTGIYEPDIIVVLDPTLPYVVDIKSGLKETGVAIFNSDKDPLTLKRELGIKAKVATVDASTIAMKILKRPIVNTAMLGSLVKVAKLVTLESISKELLERFPGDLGKRNVEAATKAYEETRVEK
jgi:2-oxoacid:acceptor oxidoreductase gamma subunit (pyruvate/2-ketoisovalerate family)